MLAKIISNHTDKSKFIFASNFNVVKSPNFIITQTNTIEVYIKLNTIDFGETATIILTSKENYNVTILFDGEETIYRDVNSINKILRDLTVGQIHQLQQTTSF